MSLVRHRLVPAALLSVAAIVLITSIGLQAARQAQAPPPSAERVAALMAKSPGELTPAEEEALGLAAEATMERVCVTCHPFEQIIRTRRTMPEWNMQVTTMAQRGAAANDKEFALVKRYLTRWYGIVHVNTAPAEELSAVLGLPPKVASAVVAYRKANGNFTDLASFENVEGVDKAKIEEQPEALKFD